MTEEIIACNRIPFQTDSSCDRGDVRIDEFIQFPICNIIDPTSPKGGPPQTDYPVFPFTPPPCSCVSISFSTQGVIENRNDLLFTAGFRAIDDCCEGNYETNLNLHIPCIMFDIKGGNTDHDVQISTECDLSSPKGTINLGIKINEDCEIEFNPLLDLTIPQIPTYTFKSAAVKIKEICTTESTPARGALIFHRTEDSCSYQITPELNLLLPRPPNYEFESGSVNIIEDCFGSSSASGQITFELEEESCLIRVKPHLELKLNKPPEYIFEDADIDIKEHYPSSKFSPFGVMTIDTEEEDCEVKVTPHLKLHLARPLTFEDVTYDFEGSGSVTIIEECMSSSPSGELHITPTIEDGNVVKINAGLFLKLKKPPTYEFESGSVDVVYDGQLDKTTLSLTAESSTSCFVVVKPKMELHLADYPDFPIVDCPIASSDYAFNAKVTWGDKMESYSRVSVAKRKTPDIYSSDSDCFLIAANEVLDLTIPCPLDNITFETEDTEYNDNGVGVYITEVDSSNGNNSLEGTDGADDYTENTESSGEECEKKWKVKLTLPTILSPDYSGPDCPIADSDYAFNAKVTWGVKMNTYEKVSIATRKTFGIDSSGSECLLIAADGKLDLTIPCPLHDISFDGSVEYADSSSTSPSLIFSDVETKTETDTETEGNNTQGSDCKRTVKATLTLPKNFQQVSEPKTLKVITGIEKAEIITTGSSQQIQFTYKTAEITVLEHTKKDDGTLSWALSPVTAVSQSMFNCPTFTNKKTSFFAFEAAVASDEEVFTAVSLNEAAVEAAETAT